MRKYSSASGLFVALASLLLVTVTFRPLFFRGLVPVDGNMARSGYPNWALCQKYISTHTPLLWNPYRNMGEPLLADPQSMAGYPIQWLLISSQVSFLSFMRLWVLIHSLIAGAFMGLLAWRWFRDPYAVCAAALLAALNGCFLSRVSLPNHFASAAYVPMVLYFTDRRSPIFLGIALALQWLAGFPPFSLLTGILSLLFACLQGNAGWISWLGGSIIGFCLSAFQSLPFLEYIRLSTRSFELPGPAAMEFSQSVGQLLKTWLLPQWYAFYPVVIGDQAIVSSYVGPVALVLALVGVWKGKKRVKGLGVIFLASFLLCLGGNLPGYSAIPLLHVFRYPANWSLVSVACLALLAASGISTLRSRTLKALSLGLLMVDLLVFAQYIRVPWLPPELLQEPPPSAQSLLSQPFTTRLYDPPFLTDLYVRQRWNGMDDFLFMKENLMPSYGMAFGVREVKSYQVLTLKSADAYQRRLLAEGMQSPLAKYAGISTVVTLQRGAETVGPKTVHVLQLKSPEKPVFILNPDSGDRIYSVQESPSHCDVNLNCDSATCLVVFSEMDYPGWNVSVDGLPVPHETFEQAFLASRVGPGTHRVVFEFTSRAFHQGLALSLIAILFVGIYGLIRSRFGAGVGRNEYGLGGRSGRASRTRKRPQDATRRTYTS